MNVKVCINFHVVDFCNSEPICSASVCTSCEYFVTFHYQRSGLRTEPLICDRSGHLCLSG